MPAVDEMFVNKLLWGMAKHGDTNAKLKIKEQLTGLVLYEHCLVMPGSIEDWELITLCDLEDVIGRVFVTIGFDA